MEPPARSVCIEVDYALGEYMSILGQYARQTDAEAPAPTSRLARLWRSRPVEAIGLALLAPPAFLVKKLVLGRCAFEFTPNGLSRLSRQRRAHRPWDRVTRVRMLASAYVLELDEGALPLPYRAFSAEQRRAFLGLLPARLHTPPHASLHAAHVGSQAP